MSAVLIAGISMSNSYDNSDQKAMRALALYTYKDSGTERMMKDYSKKILPDDFRRNAGLIFAIGDTIQKKHITLTWTF